MVGWSLNEKMEMCVLQEVECETVAPGSDEFLGTQQQQQKKATSIKRTGAFWFWTGGKLMKPLLPEP